MPADINKTIEISYRADVKNIIDGLTKTGRVSEAEARRISKSLEQAYEKATRDAEKAARKQQAEMQKTEKSAKSLGQSIGKSFSGIVTAIGAASVAAVMFGQHIADMSNQLVDASAKTGVNVDTLNGLRLAAEGAGLSFEDLEPGLIALPQLMNRAADGSKSAQEAFEKLGVQTTETVDGFQKLRSADDVLKDIFHSLQQVESAEQKAAKAAEIFGAEVGPKFVQSGAIDNLENFVALAEEFGVSTGPNMQKNMADFQRVTATAMSVVQGEFMRFMDVLAGKEAGAGGGLVDIILGATEAIVYFGTVTGDVFRGFQAGFGIILANLNLGLQQLLGTSGDVERAMIVLEETINESQPAINNFFSPFEQAEKRLDSFREKLKATMSTPSGVGGGARPDRRGGGSASIQQTVKEIDSIAEADKLILQLEEAINQRYIEREKSAIAQLEGEDRLLAEHKQKLALIDEEIERNEFIYRRTLEQLALEKDRDAAAEKQAELEYYLTSRNAQLREEKLEASQKLDEDLFEMQLQNMDELFDKQMEQDQQRLENIEKQKKAQQELYNDIREGIDITTQGISVAADLVDAFGKKNKENAILAFNIRKAAAISEIVVQTAVNMVEAAGNPFLMAAYGALGAAQTAVVASEQPSFHMGGVVAPLAPDEQRTRVLTGEAVLDRATVRRLGGETGIQRLQEGGTMAPDVIVMNPFKHLDRYNRSAIRNRNSAFSRLQPTQRQKY
jgi:hypothetical protein